jgi:hypothetical protein
MRLTDREESLCPAGTGACRVEGYGDSFRGGYNGRQVAKDKVTEKPVSGHTDGARIMWQVSGLTGPGSGAANSTVGIECAVSGVVEIG